MTVKKNQLSGKLGTIAFYGVLFLIFLAPIFRLLLMSLKGPDGYSLANFTAMTQDKRTWEAMANTLVIAVGSTLLATCSGTIMGFVQAYTNIRYKKPLELLVLLPFIIPSYIITLSWSGLLATQSTLSRTLVSLGLPTINIYTRAGIIAVLGLVNTPIVYLSVIHTLRKIPLDMDWAARACGFSPLETLWKVDLKEALPAIISGSLLSFLACIDNFAVPAFLGISSNITVLSTYIYEKAIGFGPEAFAQAAALSVVLSVIALCGTVAADKAVRTRSALDSIKEDYTPRINLATATRRKLELLLLAVWCVIDLVPLVDMVINGFLKNYGMPLTAENTTMENYDFLFSSSSVLSAIRNSLILASITCLFCIVIGTALAYWKLRKHSHAAKLAEQCASLTYALPGIVLALAMIFHWVEPFPGIRPDIYGTIVLLLIAYFTRYLILQIKGSSTALMAINPELEDAVRSSGRSQFVLWKKILLPLLIKPIVSNCSLIFISSLTELTLSSLLAGAGTKTIGLTIFNLQQGGDYSISAALSTLIVLLILGGYLVSLTWNIKLKGAAAHDVISGTRDAKVREYSGTN